MENGKIRRKWSNSERRIRDPKELGRAKAVCVCMPAFKFCPCVYPVQRIQRYLGESGGGKGEQWCKKWKEKKRERERERNWGKWWSSANWNECNGLLTAGERRERGEERRREKGNQLEREGSWSIMVSHSGTAEKRESRERQSDKENKGDKHNRRSFRQKLEWKRKKKRGKR